MRADRFVLSVVDYRRSNCRTLGQDPLVSTRLPLAAVPKDHEVSICNHERHLSSRIVTVNPLLIDVNGVLIAGHGRLLAAKSIGLDSAPTITLPHLDEAQRRALRLADNKIALNAG